jgi:uncharacterized protein Veg
MEGVLMLQIGDTILGGSLVIVDIQNNYHKFVVRSAALSDPYSTPFAITFDSDQTVADINQALGFVS